MPPPPPPPHTHTHHAPCTCIRPSQEKHANLQMHLMYTHRFSLIAMIADNTYTHTRVRAQALCLGLNTDGVTCTHLIQICITVCGALATQCCMSTVFSFRGEPTRAGGPTNNPCAACACIMHWSMRCQLSCCSSQIRSPKPSKTLHFHTTVPFEADIRIMQDRGANCYLRGWLQAPATTTDLVNVLPSRFSVVPYTL